MHLRSLEDFIVLARVGSFSRASETRNSTLSAFSRRIRHLEEQLGTALIDRSQQPLALTPAGKVLLDAAGEATRIIDQARQDIRAFAGIESIQTVRFGVPHTLALQFFPQFASRLRNTIPSIALQLVITTEAPTLLEIFERGLCDLMVYFRSHDVPVSLDRRLVEIVHLADDWLVPVSAPNPDGSPRFPVAGEGSCGTAFLHQGKGSYFGHVVDARWGSDWKRLGLRKLPLVESDKPFLQLALEGVGVAWLPGWAVRGDLGSQRLVRAAPETYDIPIEIMLARPKQPVEPHIEKVWDVLVNQTKVAEYLKV